MQSLVSHARQVEGAARSVFGLEGLGAHRGAQPLAVEASQPFFQRLQGVAQRREDLVGCTVQPGRQARVGPAVAGPGWSARLHGAADQALADLGETIEPLEGRLAGRDRQRLRAAMGAEAFEAEYAAGRTAGLAVVADEALQGSRAGRAAQPAGALVSEPDAARSPEP